MRANLLTHVSAGLIILVTVTFNAPPTEAQTHGGAFFSAGPAFVNGVGNHESAWQIGGGGEVRGTDTSDAGRHSESPAAGVVALSFTGTITSSNAGWTSEER